MLRKLLVQALALFAVLAVAGGAMAGVSTRQDAEDRRAEAQEKRDDKAQEREDAADDREDERATRSELDDDDDDADDSDDDARADSFGASRSAQVAEVKQCRDEAEDADAREDCGKAGPAWANEDHPVFGDDGAKAGVEPGGENRGDAQGSERTVRGDDDDDDDDEAAGDSSSRRGRSGHGGGRGGHDDD